MNCYHFSNFYYTFADAEKFCASRSHHLVSIHSQFDNQFISNEAAKQYGWSQFITTYFIGLTSQNSTDGKTFTWIDMSPYNFNAWAQAHSSSLNLREKLIHFLVDDGCYYFNKQSESFSLAESACTKRTMHLASIHSSFENSFVRSQADKVFGGSTDFYIGLTSEGSLDGMIFKWTDDSSLFCYFFLKENYNFHEAEQFCNDHGGHLTSILNQFENNFVRAGANQYFGITEFDVCYIGLTSLNSTDGKTYSWLDGNALDFNHWERGEPKDFVKNKCAVMRIYDGSWMTNDCVEKFPIVCKSPNKDKK
ncbi:hypothetical protein WR25_13682 [Diploscapter pachys]|uniref:C-type lectin domain-containing protein n=1 Tax=Diploscapter pachys TaxID=2018661 RepID=A0A2A2LEW5_9BILA|nr:hypothetical protein WR25_13682 [Diploscapter pachys]